MTGTAKQAAKPAPDSPGIPGRRRTHAEAPPEGTQESGAYVAEAFTRTAGNLARAKARQSPAYRGRTDRMRERKAGVVLRLNELSEDEIAAIDADYRTTMTVRSLCLKHHIHDSSLYKLAAARGWPKREQIRAALLASVDQNLMREAINDLRKESGRPLLPSAADEQAEIDRQNLSIPESAPDLEAAKSDAVLEEYALAVATVLNEARKLSQSAVGIGQELLATFEQQVRAIRMEIKESLPDVDAATLTLKPGTRVVRDAAMIKAGTEAMQKLATTYAVLVRSIQMAVDMQRQSFALDDKAGKGQSLAEVQRIRAFRAGMGLSQEQSQPQGSLPAPNPAQDVGGDAPSPMFGSYEDLVREAERRGNALN